MAQSLAYNRDCMEAMREFPDKFFDLAVVDPPYGDGLERERERERGSWNRFGQRFERYKIPDRSPAAELPREREREAADARHQRSPRRQASTGLVEPGRRSSEKNH